MSETTHFIGIGGTGLSAIARVLLERGEEVTGSDWELSPLAESLRQAGARVTIGHAAGNVNGATRVIRSSAVPDDNVEVQAARAKGIPVFKRADILAELLAGSQTIAVAGSHGKTTTSAMLAWVLTALNQRPGYILGSVAANLGSNAAAGAGRFFVIEADEYDYMFLGLSPVIALVTNVEHDHPDMFPSAADFQVAFQRFVERIVPEGVLVYCADDRGAKALAEYAEGKGIRMIAYSHKDQSADYYATEMRSQPGQGFAFSFVQGGKVLVEVALQLPGRHNAQNAAGALAVAAHLGLDLAEAALALGDFRGTERRFQVRGEAGGALIIDDYGHHPTEIRAVLAAAKARYPGRRVWALWQPHTYSRTLALREDFAAAFADADEVLVTGVYAAREQQPENFDMEDILSSIGHPAVHYSASLDEAEDFLLAHLKEGDVLIVFSAGDAIRLSESLFAHLTQKE